VPQVIDILLMEDVPCTKPKAKAKAKAKANAKVKKESFQEK
jgi:hypothetical protein